MDHPYWNEVPQNFYFQVEALVEQLQWAHAFHGLELHMVENVEAQEMEEKAFEVQHSLLGAHQVYELHLADHKEQMIVLYLREGRGGGVTC